MTSPQTYDYDVSTYMQAERDANRLHRETGRQHAVQCHPTASRYRVIEVTEIDRPASVNYYSALCPWDDADECHTARARSVAGVSDIIPTCPVHGTHPDMDPAGSSRRRMRQPESNNYAQYRGRNRNGAACTGLIDRGEVAEFVERRWRNRWSELKVEFNGHLIGKIGINEGRRIWWADE